MEMNLRGQGVFPKLLFDRREVIMPVVPVGVTSKCIFRILNDGYENLNLNHSIPQNLSKMDKFDFQVNYIDGKNLGVTKSKLRIEVSFTSKYARNFTTKLEFIDDQGWTYNIPVSGIADNSILTNCNYLTRCLDEYKIYAPDKKPITLIEEFNDNDSDDDGD